MAPPRKLVSNRRAYLQMLRIIGRSALNYDARKSLRHLERRYSDFEAVVSRISGTSPVKPNADVKELFDAARMMGVGVKSWTDLAQKGVYPGSAGTAVPRPESELAESNSRTVVGGCGTSAQPTAASQAGPLRSTGTVPEFAPPTAPPVTLDSEQQQQHLSRQARERPVPSSRVGRVARFGNLAVGISLGAAGNWLRARFAGPRRVAVPLAVVGSAGEQQRAEEANNDDGAFLSEENAERIVETLCRVRGAALKVGQMLSIQDEAVLTPRLQRVFQRVRDSADFMPTKQVKKVMRKELGIDWRDYFLEFKEKPFAAASIGQVHYAVLNDEKSSDGIPVALKIQYPGVADSIDSDMDNLMSVLKLGAFFPKGLYLDAFAGSARKELKKECNYLREAKAASIFRDILADDPNFYVPRVLENVTTKYVLAMEMVAGEKLDQCQNLAQSERDWIGQQIMTLSLRELFEFHFMQTDPNFSNFLYNPNFNNRRRIILLDFGASRTFRKQFCDDYMRILKAAANRDKAAILEWSQKIGFLTGHESETMKTAHSSAVLILGEAFASKTPFDFGQQDITRRLHGLMAIMVNERLKPPPEEIYSLHRKLSGAFLLCARLGARVQCGKMFDGIYENYKFGDSNEQMDRFQTIDDVE